MALYLIKHTKDDEIRFVGHLDLFQQIMRNITRADIGINYSHGFNPHMYVSSAQPLSVGTSSECEYLLADLTTDFSEEEIKDRLNKTAPTPVRYLSVKKVPDGTKSPMALLRAIKSRIEIKSSEDFKSDLENLLKSDNPMKYKRTTKKGTEIESEMKPLIKDWNLTYENGYTVLEILTLAGSVAHVSIEHIIDFIKININGYEDNTFIKIKRLEMYTEKNDKLIRMDEI